jgi:hypothetical protein
MPLGLKGKKVSTVGRKNKYSKHLPTRTHPATLFLGATTLGITTLSITTLGTRSLFATLGIRSFFTTLSITTLGIQAFLLHSA